MRRLFAVLIAVPLPLVTCALAAASPGQTNMASVIITLRVMPESPETDLVSLETECIKLIKAFGAMSTQVDIQPFAFGLKAVSIMLVLDEAKGDTETLEAQLLKVDGVQSVEVTDVRRTFG